MHDKRMMWAFLREFGGAMLVYSLILVCAIQFGRPMAESLLRTAVLVSPMAGFCLIIWAGLRGIRRLDEYQRRHTLETVAITAALVGGFTLTYGFLETAGFPKLSMFAIWFVLFTTWGVVSVTRAFLAR